MIVSDAATTAVTNPANLSSFAPAGTDALAVNQHMAIKEISDVAGVDGDEARAEARGAVVAIGGRLERQRQRGGLAAGRMRSFRPEIWWVPRGT